jgi:uncharacterized membrane protein YraQ (UPF0718 family)
MNLLIGITILALILSVIIDRKKTLSAIKKGLKMFIGLLPALLLVLALVSVVLYLIPNETLVKYMGKSSGTEAWFIASALGSVSLIPAFIALPVCGVLLKSGVAYSTIAVFVTTLMMVGVITLPIEAKFFGWKVSIIRNIVSLIAALIIGFLMGLFL